MLYNILRKVVICIAIENFQNNFKKGATALIILTFLQEGDLYGYQISQMMKERSDGAFSVPEGSLYPALYKLIEQGYISDEKRQVGKRLVRVYYHLEDAGRKHLQQLLSDYLIVRTGIEKILEKSGVEKINDQENT